MMEKAVGPEHPTVATALTNLAQLSVRRHEYADAEVMTRRSLAIREKALGPNHPDLETALKLLAQIYYLESRYAAAEPLYRRALWGLEKRRLRAQARTASVNA